MAHGGAAGCINNSTKNPVLGFHRIYAFKILRGKTLYPSISKSAQIILKKTVLKNT